MKHLALSLILAASAALPAKADPARDAVDALVAALKAGNTEAVAAAFTEDAGYAYSVDGDLNRGDSFDSWLQSDITGPGSVFEIEAATVADGTVDAEVLWGRGGNATRPARYIFAVKDGKIDSWRVTGR